MQLFIQEKNCLTVTRSYREKEDKIKATKSPETSIVVDQTTAINSKDHEHIKSSGIPGQCLLVNDDLRTKNSTIKTGHAVSETHSDCCILSTTLFDSIYFTSDKKSQFLTNI